MKKQILKLSALIGLAGCLSCATMQVKKYDCNLIRASGADSEEKVVVERLMEDLRYEQKLLDYKVQNSFYDPNEILIGMLER